MSQKKEKYVRNMGKRMDRMERLHADMSDDLAELKHRQEIVEEATLNTIRSVVAEKDAAEASYNENLKRISERRERRERERREQRIRRNVYLAILLTLALLLAVILFMVDEPTAEAASTPEDMTVTVLDPITITTLEMHQELLREGLEEAGEVEDPFESEKIEAALLEQGYFSDAIPLTYEYQDYMRTYSAAYGCPYPLALAVAEVESEFDMEAIGSAGEVGIMQLNPGPSGAYHKELQKETGIDPTTPSGNIAGGCYKLGQYMKKYQDAGKAAMAYNMGESGAQDAWRRGVTSTEYTEKVLEAMGKWGCMVIDWPAN